MDNFNEFSALFDEYHMPTWIESALAEAADALADAGKMELAASLRRMGEHPDLGAVMMYRSAEVEKLAYEVSECETLEALFSLLKEIVATFEIGHCTVYCVRERSTSFFGRKVLTTFPKDWVAEYVDRRYSGVDPVMLRSRQGPGVFLWGDLVVTDPHTKQFIKTSFQRGIGPGGVTFVEPSSNGSTVAVSFCAPVDHETFRRNIGPKMPDLAAIATLLIEVFSDLACEQGRSAPFSPTDDQLRVLRAVASGRSASEVESMRFNWGTFQCVERSILKGFGARTLAQAAALATTRGLLEDLPFSVDEIFLGGVESADRSDWHAACEELNR